MTVLAQLSDPHLDGTERSVERLARVIGHLAAMPGPLDLVLCTGDIADHGAADEYRTARELFKALPCPWLVLPGNHDRRVPFAEELLGRDGTGDPVDQEVTVAGAQFLLCDSTVPGRDHGLLGAGTLAWLDRELAAGPPDTPALVCCHHPPVPLHTPYVDHLRQTGEDRLARVLNRHPRAAAVLCGHAHTAAVTTFAGRPLVVAPGIASTVRLPQEFAAELDFDHPPGFLLHVLDDTGRLTTHVRAVC
jgi:Icc protein